MLYFSSLHYAYFGIIFYHGKAGKFVMLVEAADSLLCPPEVVCPGVALLRGGTNP